MTATFPFAPRTAADAHESVRPILLGSERRFGFLPEPVARVAAAPVVLRHLLAGFAAFDQTSLAPIEREVIAMTVAWEHGCRYCMAMHSALLAGAAEHRDTVAALRDGTPLADARLEALRALVRELLAGRGRPSEDAWRAFAAAGFTEQQALEVVLGVGAYALSTFLNMVTRAPLDAAFASFDWSRPVEQAA